MRTTLTRIGIAAAVGVFLLAAVAVVMFAFGKPVTPEATAVTAAEAPAAVPATAAAPSDPLAVEIPGCVCHSGDPAVVAEHAGYRMSQCFDCHADGVPEMGQ